jgi:hypothetical protein
MHHSLSLLLTLAVIMEQSGTILDYVQHSCGGDWRSFMAYILLVHVYMPCCEPVKNMYYILFTSVLYFLYFLILYDVMCEDFS